MDVPIAGSEITFEDSGAHDLKGVGEWRLYAVSEERARRAPSPA